MLLQIGDQLANNRYTISEVLWHDRSHAHYRAVDHQLFDQSVLLMALPEMAQAALMSRVALRHPVLPRTITTFRDGPTAYLVGEDVAGERLEESASQQPYPVADVYRWSRSLCDLLIYLEHQQFALAPVARLAMHLRRDHTGAVRYLGALDSAQPDSSVAQSQRVVALAALLYRLAYGNAIEQHPRVTPSVTPTTTLGDVLSWTLARDGAPTLTAQMLAQHLERLTLPDERPALRAPDGSVLSTRSALATWCQTHWHEAARWLAGTLPADVDQVWHDVPLATALQLTAARYDTDARAGVDALLTVLAPQQYDHIAPQVDVQPPTLTFAARHGRRTPGVLQITNSGRRYVEAPIRAPAWLTATPALIALAPGEQTTVTLRRVEQGRMPNTASGTVTIGDRGAELVAIPVRTTRTRWPGAWLWAILVIAVCMGVLGGVLFANRQRTMSHVATAQLRLQQAIPLTNAGGDSTLWSLFAPDEHRVVSYGGAITLWNTSDGQRVRALDHGRHGSEAVAFSPDGTLYAYGDDGQVVLRRLDNGQVLYTLRASAVGVSGVAFSPDGQLLATSGGGYGSDGPLRLWRVRDGALVGAGHTSGYTLAWSPDGRLLAGAGEQATAQIWAVPSLAPVHILAGHYGVITHVAWSPDGQYLVSSSEDATLKLWRVADGVLERTFAGHRATVRSVAFAAGGAVLVSGAADGTLRVWRADDGAQLHVIKAHPLSVESISVSMDGTVLATSGWDDATIKLWHLDTSCIPSKVVGHFTPGVCWYAVC